MDIASSNREISKTERFNSLVEKFSERIYWTVRKMVLVHDDANDVTQEVFLKVWKNLDGFKGESSPYTWLHRIAINESLNFIDKKKRKIGNSEWSEHQFSSLISDDYFDGDEEIKKLHKVLLTLPDKQRLVFNLKYFEDKPYAEIAELTGTSIGALKASYHIAVKKIKEILSDG